MYLNLFANILTQSTFLVTTLVCFVLLPIVLLLPQALFQDGVLSLWAVSVLQTNWQFKVRTLCLKKKLTNVYINSRLRSLQPQGIHASPSFPRTQPSFLLLAEISNDEWINKQIQKIIIIILKDHSAWGCNSALNAFLSSTIIFSLNRECLKHVQRKTSHCGRCSKYRLRKRNFLHNVHFVQTDMHTPRAWSFCY